jgi:hypothetical protein
VPRLQTRWTAKWKRSFYCKTAAAWQPGQDCAGLDEKQMELNILYAEWVQAETASAYFIHTNIQSA